MIGDAILSRVGLGLSAVLAVSLVSTCAVDGVKIRNRDKEIETLTTRIEAPVTGYIARQAQCQSESTQLRKDLDTQNEKVTELRDQGEKATRAAQAAVDAAQRAQATAERRATQILASQPKPDEDRCAAAVRVIQESVR